MRIALTLIIGIHGLIHLFGFFKAFVFPGFQGITQPVSKFAGMIWLLAFLLFAITLFLYRIRSQAWWLFCCIASITSQVLILSLWSDAKTGTLVNVVLLLAVILSYADFRFRKLIEKERSVLFQHLKTINDRIVNAADLSALPPAVQKWLFHSGITGKPLISNVHLTQELELRLKPGQKKWIKASAEQYFTVHPPAFHWNLETKIAPFLSMSGRDKFENGKGEMLIKLFSLFTVAHAKNNAKTDEATIQRYLAEIVWFPTAALNDYIQWEGLDDLSARATMEHKGTKGSGIFYFDENGQFEKFVTTRFMNNKDEEPVKWIVTATETEVRNGIKIPTACEATWHLNTGQWTWLKLNIGTIEYNQEIKQ
ncbi:DUF6920 family protein [Robertkochia flava]|uniref:DUF6920 family protein n=1 Tax=Robertkochia flava TaxID=3447986 RepID=UPI001CC9A513|nr:DUF6544 family protein [Robertkochia marina]